MHRVDGAFALLWVVVLTLGAIATVFGSGRVSTLFVVFIALAFLIALMARHGSIARSAQFYGVIGAFLCASVWTNRTQPFSQYAARVGLEALVLAAICAFEWRYWHGLAHIESFVNETEQAGYARVLDRRSSRGEIQAEISRGARYDQSLAVIVLEQLPTRSAQATAVASALESAGAGVTEHLTRALSRAQVCSLVSELARRSDLVVAEADSRVVVVSTGTSRSGGEAVAERILRASSANLGVSLAAGVAVYPLDGANVDELLEIAASRVHSSDEARDERGRRRRDRSSEVARLPTTGTEA
jgi:hypothetical protein